MAESSNPAIPSRFNMGVQRFSRFVPEDDGYRPPTLTAQGREDVERLRAKVRKHNPGYIYTNGVSLPSQLPSVPELLDELASHVRSARSDHGIPNTPLPEVETSELAKAGFDWKAIADCAIEALETGSRRPLPLANDPSAAEIPGLNIIAAARAVSPATPASQSPAELESETLPTETSASESERQPSEALEPEASATPTETPADATEPSIPEYETPVAPAPQTTVAETPMPEEPVPSPEESVAGVEPAPETAQPTLDHEPPVTEVPFVEQAAPSSVPELAEVTASDAEAVEVTEESPAQSHDAQSPEDAVEQPSAEFTEEQPVEVVPEELSVAETENEIADETLSAELSAAEDLVSERVYDDNVLEAEGNDDERFVGDVEGEMAHWVVNPEETGEVSMAAEEPAVTTDETVTTDEVAATEEPSATDLVTNSEQTASSPDSEVAAELPPAALLEETEINEPLLETELTQQDAVSTAPVAEEDLEITEETPVVESEQPDVAETDSTVEPSEELSAELPEQLPEELPETAAPITETEDTFVETDVDLGDLDFGDLDDLAPEIEPVDMETMPESGHPEQVEESVADGLADTAESEEELPTEQLEDTEASAETALPGSEAIGMEEPAADFVSDSELVDQDEIDLGDFADTDSEVPTELPVASSDELTESDVAEGYAETAVDAADQPYLGENAEEMLTQVDQTESVYSEEEVPFDIPQVQGDIPEAMQEGYPEWDSTADAEEMPGADEELFAGEYEAGEYETQPIKQGFFSRLFSKKSKNAG